MRTLIAIAALTLLGSTAFAAGEVYRWKDANGVWHYSDQPRPGAEVMRGGYTTGTTTAPSTPATPVQTPTPAPATSNDPLPVSKEVAQEVRQEAAAAKAKACEKAKTDYEEKVKALRIKRVDAKGNTTFLSEAEIDAARLEARATRDLACAP